MLMTSGFPNSPHIHHFPTIDIVERRRLHGYGHVEPLTPVTAGECVTLKFQFELGETAIRKGGHLRIAWLWPFDWAELQTSNPGGEGHVSARAKQGVRLRVAYAFRGDLIPWNHHIDIKVASGSLESGDVVDIACYNWHAPTFVVPAVEFLFLINPDGGDRWLQLPASEGVPIVTGPPSQLFVVGPADGVVGEQIDLTIRVEDQWGNPQLLLEPPPRLERYNGLSSTAVEPIENMPAYRGITRFTNPGIYRLEAVVDGSDLRAVTNPIRITEERPDMRIFWGDLHAGQSSIGCGIGSIRQHFQYARCIAGLQVCSHQANDHHVSLDLWEQIRRESAAAHNDGHFVAFLGCEWSAYTPHGGDRNVFYRRDEPRLRRSGRFFTEDISDPEPDLVTAREFLETIRDEEVFINLHAGGRPTNLDFHEPRIETLAEVHSTHGTSEWFVLDALRRGYRVGITGGTDGVTGRPGCDHPGNRLIRNVRSGVTAFLAPELTADGLWEAITRRRCYATDGERILLEVTVDGHQMGEEYDADGPPLIAIAVEGTSGIEQVDLLCGPSVMWTWRAKAGADNTLRLLWGGTAAHGSAPAQRVLWKGQVTVVDGGIARLEPVALIIPCDRIQQVDEHTVHFSTVTAGNRMGMLLDVTGDEATTIRFESGPANFKFGLAQVTQTPITFDAGGVSRHVIVGPAPDRDLPKRVELTYQDKRPVTGVCPYWVRITQTDQHRAWSSPVYATRRPTRH